MKTLLLMRHAKSSWKEGDIADIDRPLNKRGKREAARLGRLIKEEDLLPDVIISSPALRARLTAESVADQSGYQGEILYRDDLYASSLEIYLSNFRSLAEIYNRVLFIGHNPELEELVELLTGKFYSISTANLIYLILPVRLWQDISAEQQAKLVYIWRPKELP